MIFINEAVEMTNSGYVKKFTDNLKESKIIGVKIG